MKRESWKLLLWFFSVIIVCAAIAGGIIVFARWVAPTGKAEVTEQVNDYEVDRLFTVDGCTVYRFKDSGYNRYFTNCSGSTMWQQSTGGKNSSTFEMSVEGGR